jgi:multidrug efflux system outer membrane protein
MFSSLSRSCLFTLILATWLVLSGCKTLQPLPLPEERRLPGSFRTYTDTSLPVLQYRDIFTDPNLQALIDTALHNNYDLKAGVQRIRMAAASTRIARAALLPTLNGVASGSVDRYGKYTMNGVGNFDTNLSPNIDKDQRVPNPVPDFFVGFRSSWEADIWGKLNDRRKAAYSRYLASRKGQQWFRTQLVAQVADLYYQLAALDKQAEILGRNITLQKKGVEIMEAQLAGGRATALAVRQFRAQLLRTQGSQYEIRQEMVRVQNDLNALLGRFGEAIRRDTAALHLQLPARLNAGQPATLILNRPDVQEAELELLATKADVQAARKAFLPSLNFDAYASFNAFRLPLLFRGSSLAAGILGGLSAPLLNRGAIKGNFATANAAQLNAFYQYQQQIVQAYQEIATQLAAIHNYEQAFGYKSREVAELREALTTANDLYLAGYATYLEVVVAQGSVLSAEMEQVDIKRQWFSALINLFRATGGMTEVPPAEDLQE